MRELKRHPLSYAFPDMPEDEFQDLVESVRREGLLDPIVLFNGMVLDGWHRYRACIQARIEPRFTTFDGADPRDFVVSKNSRRRHLNKGQRATAIVQVWTWAHPGLMPDDNKLARMADASVATIKHAKSRVAEGLGGAVIRGDVPLKKARVSKRAKRVPLIEDNPSNKQGAEILRLRQLLRERDAQVLILSDQIQAFTESEKVVFEGAESINRLRLTTTRLSNENVALRQQIAEHERTLGIERPEGFSHATGT